MPQPDPTFPGGVSPYAYSGLADVCGTVSNPYAAWIYRDRGFLCSAEAPLNACYDRDGAGLETWLADLGGFDPRCRFWQPPASKWPLHALIGRIEASEKPGMPLPAGTYMIDWRYLVYADGCEKSWAQSLRERFEPGTRLLLTFWNDNARKQRLWLDDSFWQRPLLDQFDAIVAPVFRGYDDDPYPQMYAGERMNQKFIEEGVAAGRVVIPSLAFTHPDSLRRQVELFASSEQPFTVHIDANGHGLGSPVEWRQRWLMALERYCAPQLHLRFLISGLHQDWCVSELNRIFPRRNWQLVAPLPAYVDALSSTMTPEQRRQRYVNRLEQLAELYWGRRQVAMPQPYPDTMPTWADYGSY